MSPTVQRGAKVAKEEEEDRGSCDGGEAGETCTSSVCSYMLCVPSVPL